MTDTERGIYEKFKVERTDGSSGPGGKHEGCSYFVLDLLHDPHAWPALVAYRDACRATHPQLADSLTSLIYAHWAREEDARMEARHVR